LNVCHIQSANIINAFNLLEETKVICAQLGVCRDLLMLQ